MVNHCSKIITVFKKLPAHTYVNRKSMCKLIIIILLEKNIYMADGTMSIMVVWHYSNGLIV